MLAIKSTNYVCAAFSKNDLFSRESLRYRIRNSKTIVVIEFRRIIKIVIVSKQNKISMDDH
jgi:hypothetical protein